MKDYKVDGWALAAYPFQQNPQLSASYLPLLVFPGVQLLS
jgi:hypothetical protein